MWAHRDMKIRIPHYLGLTQLFFRSGIPHHRGSARTFTAVRISRRSYKKRTTAQYVRWFFLRKRREWDLNPRMSVLQTDALGHLAIPPCLVAGAIYTKPRYRSSKFLKFFVINLISCQMDKRPRFVYREERHRKALRFTYFLDI